MLYFALVQDATRANEPLTIKSACSAYPGESAEAALAAANLKEPEGSAITVICRSNGIPTYEAACELTALLSVTPGVNETEWLEVDSGPYVSPRYDVIAAPKVGNEVSYTFNGDYYPAGKITKVSASKRRVESTGDDGRVYIFWRLRNTGCWKMDRTWSMVGGRHDKRNPEF